MRELIRPPQQPQQQQAEMNVITGAVEQKEKGRRGEEKRELKERKRKNEKKRNASIKRDVQKDDVNFLID